MSGNVAPVADPALAPVTSWAPAAPAAPVLERVMGRWDTVLFLVSAIVAVDTIGAIAVGGVQAFGWMVVLAVTFFVPAALATAELGTALPAEGGPYVWVRTAFGQHAGALTGFFYWAATPIWVGGSVSAVALVAVDRLVVPLSLPVELGVGLAFVAACTAASLLPLRVGKWVPTSGALAQVGLLALFTATVVAYGARHGWHAVHAGDLRPTSAVFVTVVPVLLYSFVGVELPTSAGEELRDPVRDVPAAILRAGIAQAVMYGVPMAAVLLALPADRITSVRGLVDAIATTFTVYGGSVEVDGAVHLTGSGALMAGGAGIAVVWILLTSAVSWTMGTSRTQAAACRDGSGPAWFGVLSPRSGVPTRIVLLTGLLSGTALVLGLVATHGDGVRFFTIGLTGAVSFALLSFLAVFGSVVRLRRSAPALDRPFRVPGGRLGATLAGGLPTVWVVVGLVCLLWPGLGTADPDAYLPAGFAGDRTAFEFLALAPVVAALAAYAIASLTGVLAGDGWVRRPRIAARHRRSAA